MAPKTVYVSWRGVLSVTRPSAQRRGFPVLATVLGVCAGGWFSIGGLLLTVDLHSWDVIILLTVLGTAFYLLMARLAYRDWLAARAEKP